MSKIKNMIAGAAGRVLKGNGILVLCIYLETVFHILNFKKTTFYEFIIGLISAVVLGSVLRAITGLFNKTVNLILTFAFATALTGYYMTQMVYYNIFHTYFSISVAAGVGTNVFQFIDVGISGVKSTFGQLLLLALPEVTMIVLAAMKKTDFSASPLKVQIRRGIVLVASVILFHLSLLSGGQKSFSPADLYYRNYIMENGVEKLGMLVNLKFDLIDAAMNRGFLPKSKKVIGPVNDAETAVSEDYRKKIEALPKDKLNVSDIDFSKLAENEKDGTIKNLHTYFANRIPTEKNDFTGMFKGYNLVFITAESWYPPTVREDTTPTLYKMLHSGFEFKNFYNPLWKTSTSDGEFANISGLKPDEKISSMRTAGNAMPYALGNRMKSAGYKTYAYHNNVYDYYSRNLSHPNFGYDVFRGIGGGVVNGEDKKEYGLRMEDGWPKSDEELMRITAPEYIGEYLKTGVPFHAYYMSVSGHMLYGFDVNDMSKKHEDKVKDLPYSDVVKAFIAANYEIELMVNELVKQLSEAGILDKTVIVISADHYPYGLISQAVADDEETGGDFFAYINEMAGHTVDTNFEIFRNNLLLWSASMKEPVEVTKACSTLDIVPTLMNLFGIEYDARLYQGRDIMSSSPAFVVFDNMNFITDRIEYITLLGTYRELSGPVSAEYVDEMVRRVKNMFKVSKAVIDRDYFAKINAYLK